MTAQASGHRARLGTRTLTSVVVPVYCNSETLCKLLERLAAVAAIERERDFEFLFVDDGSGDNSFDVLQQMASENPCVRVLKLSRNYGSNAAILAGLSYSRGDCVVVLTADLQDPPELIPRLIDCWEEGNQVVMAARRKRRDPLVSRLFASVFNHLFRWLVFRDFPANGFDFVLLDRRVVAILVALDEKNSYLFGQILWVGFKRCIVYYDREERKQGVSRWTTMKKIKYFIDAFTAFSYLPLRAAALIGIALSGLGFLYALFVIGLRITNGIEITGWASLSVIILVTSGAQLLLMGISGEYLWRVLDETRRRPPFIVESGVNLDADPVALAETHSTAVERGHQPA
jgi:polyisoprenyl-phosphate glycosyltransferase